MRKFYSEIGVVDVHSKVNNIGMNDSAAASSGVLDHIEGSTSLECNEPFKTDYAEHMIDIALDEC